MDLVQVLVEDRAHQALGPLAQCALEVDHAQELTGGSLQRRTAYEGHRR